MNLLICFATRLLLQGLATNKRLFGLELDLSSCEVHTHIPSCRKNSFFHLWWMVASTVGTCFRPINMCLFMCSYVQQEPRWYRNTSLKPQPSEVWISLTTVCKTTFLRTNPIMPYKTCKTHFSTLKFRLTVPALTHPKGVLTQSSSSTPNCLIHVFMNFALCTAVQS